MNASERQARKLTKMRRERGTLPKSKIALIDLEELLSIADRRPEALRGIASISKIRAIDHRLRSGKSGPLTPDDRKYLRHALDRVVRGWAETAAQRKEREAAEAEAEHGKVERIMRTAPGASSVHRGIKSTFNTADPGTVRREPDAPRERLDDGRRHPVTTRKAER